MVTTVVTVYVQGLSLSTTAAFELLGNAFGGSIAERPRASAEYGAKLLGLQQQLFGHWHHNKEGTIDWPALQRDCRPAEPPGIRAHLPAVPEGDRWVVDFLGDSWHRAHQEGRRACPATAGDSAQDQSRHPIPPRCDLAKPTAHGHHHSAPAGPGYLGILEQAWIAHHRGGVMRSLLPYP